MAGDEPDLNESVANSADGPAEVAVAGMGMSREQRLDHKIQAAKFLPPVRTRSRVGGGIKFTKASAGGAV